MRAGSSPWCRTARPTRPTWRRRRGLLREAAALTDNASLKKFLTLRADAFLSNDYYASDLAWMDLDAPLDITIGPYETYNDELFGYKAAFEAYITIRDDRGNRHSSRLFAGHLQEVENNLPHRRRAIAIPSWARRRPSAWSTRSRGRRWRARRAHRGLQSAQRRAGGPRRRAASASC